MNFALPDLVFHPLWLLALIPLVLLLVPWSKERLYAVADGKIIPSNDLPHLFGKETEDCGYLIKPTSEAIYAPVRGKVTAVDPVHNQIVFQSAISNTHVVMQLHSDDVTCPGWCARVGDEVRETTRLSTISRDANHTILVKTQERLAPIALEQQALDAVKSAECVSIMRRR